MTDISNKTGIKPNYLIHRQALHR